MYRQGNQQILINIATKDWLSCDLVIACAQRFAERSQNDLKAVYDPKSLLNTLRIAPKPPTTDKTRLTALVQEFLRILGLLPAGIKRGALYTVQFGLGILRDHVAQFLTEAAGLTGRSGALNLSRDLSSKDMSLLNNLPIGSKSAQPLIEDNVKIAIVFLPLAKRHCDTHGAAWPADLINAAANSLATLIGDANAQQFRQLQH